MLRCFIAILLAAAAGIQPPPPPYVRHKTAAVYSSTFGQPDVFWVERNVLYTSSGFTCSAFELPALNKRWTIKFSTGEQSGSLAAAGGTVYLATDPPSGSKEAHLHALDAGTGRIKWSLPRTGDASRIGIGRGLLYLAMEPHSLSAVDPKTRKRLWTHTFPAPSEPSSTRFDVDAVTVSGDYVLVNDDAVTYCLEASSGGERWRQPKSYARGEELLAVDGVAAVPAGEGMVGRDLRSGAVRWILPAGMSDGAKIMGSRFVVIDRSRLRSVDARSGKVHWSKTLGPGNVSGGDQYVSVFGNRIYARGIDRAGIYDGDGRALSSGSAEYALPHPIWSDGKVLLCFDGSRLLTYRSGREASLPRDATARRRLAAQLVGRFETLDATEIARLRALKDDAFEPVLAALRRTCAAHDANEEARDSYALYQKYHALAEVLGKIGTPQRSGALLRALREEKKSGCARPMLLDIAARVGDPALVTPYFLEQLVDFKTPGFEWYESTTYVVRRYIVRSKDPIAVAFLINHLHDPETDGTLRVEAYRHLAGSGNPDAVKAVLAARSRRTPLGSITQRVIDGVRDAGASNIGTKVLAEQRDAGGHAWGLLESGALGSRGDLWLAEKVDGSWTRPLFSGVSSVGISGWVKPRPPEPTIGGKTGKELAAGGWFDALVKNAEIRRDSDGDGLTDLVEKRLGTDPNVGDSDGDGDPDGVDPWPNAAPRELSDEEKVYAAVFEARYHVDGTEGPALVFAPGKMKPFEMAGRQGRVLWVAADTPRWTHPLEHCYEQGVAFINFQQPNPGPRRPEVIRWNKDGTEADLIITNYYGGRSGTGYRARVRKIEDQWVVVAMDRAFAS